MNAIPVNNPVTGASLYTIDDPSESEIRAAFAKAREGAAKLRQTSVKERQAEIRRLIDYLMANRERLLDRVVEETGRCRTDAMISDLFQLVEDCQWLVDNADKILRDQKVPTPITLLGKKSRIYHEARGVVLVISPWNLPLAIAMTAAMFAFAAGNAVIIKPSEQTPMADVFKEIVSLSPLLSEAITVVQGGGETAQQLIAMRPDMIVFTGSGRTGKKILAQAAPMVIPVVMELGAKDAMIVFDDADMDRAVAAATWGNMHNSGQSCTATERLFVHDSIYDTFVERLKKELEASTLGLDGNADVGAITTDFQADIIDRHLVDAREKGAHILCGGQRLEAGSRFFQPTLVADATEDMLIAKEETFGPVVSVYRFTSEEEVIARHNACDFGLSTSLWTQDSTRADRVSRALETGCVNVNNVMLTEGNVHLPFGGVKYSGYGRMKGAEGLLGMTRSKAVLIDSTRGKREPNWYPYSREKLALMDRLLATVVRPAGLRKLISLAGVGLAIEKLVRRK